jgi:hypothetical protein
MNEQTRAAAMTAPEDAWDRLAALAFGDTASAGGCSVHTHDCTCLAQEHVSVGVELTRSVAEPPEPSQAATDDAAAPGVPPPPDPHRPAAMEQPSERSPE